jgi:secreted trypsin-like serine protease
MIASRGGVFVGFVLVLLLAIDPPTSLAEQLELSIGRLNYAGFSEKQHCTATLVAPQVALTARHCLVDDEVQEMHLLLGYEGDDWREHLRPASAQFTALPGDIALLCLDQASTAEPIAIADRPAERGETLLVIGYGRPNVYVANRTSCRVLHVDAQGAFLLDCPLTPGASGAPVLRATDAGYEIVGVVSATNGDASVGYGIAGQDGTAPCGPALPDN